MRNRKTQGFTLIELLIVIAIIGILAAVLIPNLLTARARAFDTSAQTCLKEISTAEEMAASVPDWQYTDGTTFAQTATGNDTLTMTAAISSCRGVTVTATGLTDGTGYTYTGAHYSGTAGRVFTIGAGTGVTSN